MNDATQFFDTTAPTGYNVERSLRFNSSDSAYLSRTPASAGNRKTWTWAGWVKRTVGSSDDELFSTDSSDGFVIRFVGSTSAIRIYSYSSGSYQLQLVTTPVYRDPSAWYHLVVSVDTTQATSSNRAKIYVNGTQVTAFSTAAYPSQNTDLLANQAIAHFIGKNAWGVSGLNAYLADIHFIDGQALTPSSFTEVDATTGQLIPKAYTGSFGTNGFKLNFSNNAAATAAALGKDTSGNGNNFTPNNFSVTGLVDHTPTGLSYRDSSTTSRNWDQSSASSTTSAAIGPDRIYWVDLGASKSFNRITFSVVASGQSSDTSTNFITYFSTSSSSTGSTICGGGCTVTSASRPSATTPGTITVTFAGFASQTGRYIGITNGSGAQGGTYTYSNFKVYDDQGKDNDSLVDTPTSYGTDTGAGGEVRGNYCTWNPLSAGNTTLSNGNLSSVTINQAGACGTMQFPPSGKWLFELTFSQVAGQYNHIGIIKSNPTVAMLATTANTDAVLYRGDGKVYRNTGGGYSVVQTVSSYTSGDVIGVAVNNDASTIQFYKNGSTVGTAISLTAATEYTPFIHHGGNSTSGGDANFGQRPFAYSVSGFKALCDTNLPAPVVAKPSTVFDTKLYTGNGSTQNITGLGFSPDLVWIKGRSFAEYHGLFDTVRGTGKVLFSNATDAENSYTASTQNVTAFNSDGFSLGTDGPLGTNRSSTTYAAWAWDGGSSTVTNTQGSITSQVRANASAGFSIVTYTGPGPSNNTVGHGLGVAPELIITKNRDRSIYWIVYTKATGKDAFLRLNTTDASTASSNIWGTAAPTSTVFGGVGTDLSNGYTAGEKIVSYCFAPVAGYSSFGRYTGNGSTDGPFVYTGFRSRFVLIKRTDAADNWVILDTARNTYNSLGEYLLPNTSDGGASTTLLDINSNGFKLRFNGTTLNASGGTYLFAAFASHPFQYARAR